jgi:hypothetical protein
VTYDDARDLIIAIIAGTIGGCTVGGAVAAVIALIECY